MTAATVGDPVSPWVTLVQLQADARLAAVDPAILTRSAQAATDLLWALSGRQFHGLREAQVSILPPACGCFGDRWTNRSDMWSAGSTVGGLGWAPWGWGCGCHVSVDLPDRPVIEIASVTIDGDVLDPAAYRLDDNATLVRVTDGDLWPLAAGGVADEQTPRMVVAYTWGLEPPAGGVAAAAQYATELALAATGSSDCRLPDRVTSITRQDLIKTFADPQQLVENGLTGLTGVDVWVRSVNPRAQTGARPRVLSPDLPRMRRTS